MPSREEMIAYMKERLEDASDLEVEQFYWFFMGEDEQSTKVDRIAIDTA